MRFAVQTKTPEWGPAEPLTIEHLAELFEVTQAQARNAAWLYGDEMEYVHAEAIIPESLIGPVMEHLVEIYRHNHLVPDPQRDPVPFSHAMSWYLTQHTEGPRKLVTNFFQRFEYVALGGYRKRDAYARE